MDWQAAGSVAAEIAAAWQAEGGPGGAILVFDAERVRAEACGGFANLDFALPFGAETAARYASITKHFVAALALRLADEGRLGLDDPLGRHLPGLAPAPASVSIGRALDMTGGLPDAMETLWLLGGNATTSIGPQPLLRFVSALDALNFPQGSQISYSNTGYRLLQAALEAGAEGLEAQLAARFFRPLGLSVRLPEDETDPVAKLATGYWKSPRGWLRGRYGLHVSASGGLAGSARDLATWLQALLADRAPAAGLLARLAATRRLADGRPTGYGLGLARTMFGGRSFVGHGGSLPGYKNHFLLDMEGGAGVVVLSNREETDAHGIAIRVVAALTGAPEPAPADFFAPAPGRYVADEGPFWVEYADGALTYLGAQETLVDGGGGWAVSRSAHLPMRVRQEGADIVGEIGHKAWRFRPVTPAAADPGWAGSWVCPEQHARFDIEVGGGEAWLSAGSGAFRERLPMIALPGNRALATRRTGPWTQRICLGFEGDSVRLVTSRSRVIRYIRSAR